MDRVIREILSTFADRDPSISCQKIVEFRSNVIKSK